VAAQLRLRRALLVLVVPALGQLVGCEFIAGVRDIGETTEDAENGDDGPTGGFFRDGRPLRF